MVYTDNQSKKDNIINVSENIVKTNYKNIYDSFKVLADTVFKGYIKQDDVIDAFNKRDRQRLYNILSKDYDYLESINFKQIHFYLPNNVSFLRMHKPGVYGDDLSHIRYSVSYTNKYMKSISGLEMGRIIPGFRYVYPLFNNEGNYIGSVESSFSVKSFSRKLESVYDVYTHFLLKKDIFDKKIFAKYSKQFIESIESPDYIWYLRDDIDFTKKKQMSKLFKNELKQLVENGIKTNKTFSFEIKIHKDEIDEHKVVTFLLLNNIENKKMGYYVVYQDSKELKELEYEVLLNIFLLTFILTLVFLLLYVELTKKEELNLEVKNKTKALRKLNDTLEKRISDEVEKRRVQEEQLFEIEKMAQMGEMIGNIAHQWRQPLSAISTSASGIKLRSEWGEVDKKDISEYMDSIVKNTKYLSETIDTFRDFIKEDKKLDRIILQDVINQSLTIVSASLSNNFIKVIKEFEDEDIHIQTIAKELSQVIINLLSNAKDIIIERKIEDPWIKIKLTKEKNFAIVSIEDNAGGIHEKILPKIFDPYFTTKHQSIGTGLGLHMSKNMVHASLKGKLYVQNSAYGAKFYIELPL